MIEPLVLNQNDISIFNALNIIKNNENNDNAGLSKEILEHTTHIPENCGKRIMKLGRVLECLNILPVEAEGRRIIISEEHLAVIDSYLNPCWIITAINKDNSVSLDLNLLIAKDVYLPIPICFKKTTQAMKFILKIQSAKNNRNKEWVLKLVNYIAHNRKYFKNNNPYRSFYTQESTKEIRAVAKELYKNWNANPEQPYIPDAILPFFIEK